MAERGDLDSMDAAGSVVFGGQSRTREGRTSRNDTDGDCYRVGISNNSALSMTLSLSDASDNEEAAVWLIEDKDNDGQIDAFDGEILASKIVRGRFPNIAIIVWFNSGPAGLFYVRVISSANRTINYKLDLSGTDSRAPRPELLSVSIEPFEIVAGKSNIVTVRARNARGLGGPDSSITASVLYADGSTSDLDTSGPDNVGWASHAY